MSRQFEMTGFKHVTLAGAAAFVCMMESEGSVAMLWDIDNQRRADVLMQEANFSIQAYCKRRSTTEEEFDAVLIELHDELVDARFALEYAFAQNLNDIDCPAGSRILRNIKHIKQYEELVTNRVSKRFSNVLFKDRAEMEHHVFEYFETGEYVGPITIRTVCTPDAAGECCSPQDFNFTIDGAGDYNFFMDMCNSLEEDYEKVTFTRIK